MRALQMILIGFHGLIHLMGFSKAFGLADINHLHRSITKTNGILWFIAAVLFINTAIVFFLRVDWWWMLAGASILVSQYLIFTSWQFAKFGTLANSFILIAAIIGFGAWNFGKNYNHEVKLNATEIKNEILTEEDIQNLPDPVKKYLRYTGVIGIPKVRNFRVEFSGQLRQSEKTDWMPFTSQQYNFVEPTTRLFFMKAIMKHLPVAGFHCFKNGTASMDIRLFSLFNIQYQSGNEMDISETVTFFNDMCVMAPSTLIDNRIKWISINNETVKAEFTNSGITISALLYFNDKGELINFISDDRFAATEDGTMKKARWSTPLSEYKEINGYKLPSYAEAIYSYPDGDFCYGKFRLTDVDYNVKL